VLELFDGILMLHIVDQHLKLVLPRHQRLVLRLQACPFLETVVLLSGFLPMLLAISVLVMRNIEAAWYDTSRHRRSVGLNINTHGGARGSEHHVISVFDQYPGRRSDSKVDIHCHAPLLKSP
jgi:hypothetical protein